MEMLSEDFGKPLWVNHRENSGVLKQSPALVYGYLFSFQYIAPVHLLGFSKDWILNHELQAAVLSELPPCQIVIWPTKPYNWAGATIFHHQIEVAHMWLGSSKSWGHLKLHKDGAHMLMTHISALLPYFFQSTPVTVWEIPHMQWIEKEKIWTR